MNVDRHTSDTPIYDGLVAEKEQQFLATWAATLGKLGLDLTSPETSNVIVIPPAELSTTREPKLLSLDGYSLGAQHVAHTINTAIERGEYEVMGSSFIDYVNDNKRFITAQEFSKLYQAVRAL